jgi:serine/threonine protein kinase
MLKPPKFEKQPRTERDSSSKRPRQREAVPRLPKAVTRGVLKAKPVLNAKETVVKDTGEKKISHRDVKPADIKVVSPRTTKVLDFGIANRPECSDDTVCWNNLCAALAEETLLGETPTGSPDDVDRIRKRIARLIESRRGGPSS